MQTITNPKAFKLMMFVDHDKKIFNPGLIVSNPLVEKEVCLIGEELRRAGRNVDVMCSLGYPDIKRLPADEKIAKIFPSYTYDMCFML